MRKYTFNNVIEEFNKTDYILLSTEEEYQNCNSKMRYICPKHKDKGEQLITLNHIINGRGCYYCGRKRTEKGHMVEFDKEYDKKLCESRNFEYIDTIRKKYGNDTKITIVFICNNHRELGQQYMIKKNMERNIKGCKYCNGKELPEWYVLQKAKELNPNIKLLESYKNLTTSMNCLCLKHNYPTRKTMQQIFNGQGCHLCGIEKSSNKILSIDEYKNRLFNFNQNLSIVEYYGISKDAKFKCNFCNKEWKANAENVIINNTRCPYCQQNYYKTEVDVANLLNEWGILYTQQYRFEDCKDKRTLPFDFYLYEYNVCIEFDGRQHYTQIDYFNNSLDYIKSHDDIKNDYCKKNNIDLIRIPYWVRDNGDLEYYLFDELVKQNVLKEI